MTSTPRADKVSINTSEQSIVDLLNDLFVAPRRAIQKWARITRQTAQVRLAYPGQHLASMITGVPGEGTAARGNDLSDGSEVKSCSRADQLGTCNECGSPVLSFLEACPDCSSENVRRKTDSHWILQIPSEGELNQYLTADRVIFILFDRPSDAPGNIRVRAWEVWPKEPRHRYFAEFVTDYYKNNYVRKRQAGGDPAPCNLHPLKRDFLLMNPVKVFEAEIASADAAEQASATVSFWHDPRADRSGLPVEPMAARAARREDRLAVAEALDPDHLSSLTGGELDAAAIRQLQQAGRHTAIANALVYLDERARLAVPFREKAIKEHVTKAQRRATRTI